jgi:hypothetical protein
MNEATSSCTFAFKIHYWNNHSPMPLSSPLEIKNKVTRVNKSTVLWKYLPYTVLIFLPTNALLSAEDHSFCVVQWWVNYWTTATTGLCTAMFNATLVSVHFNGNLFASSLLTEPYIKNTVYSYVCKGGFGGLEVACWPLVPKFAGSNPA